MVQRQMLLRAWTDLEVVGVGHPVVPPHLFRRVGVGREGDRQFQVQAVVWSVRADEVAPANVRRSGRTPRPTSSLTAIRPALRNHGPHQPSHRARATRPPGPQRSIRACAPRRRVEPTSRRTPCVTTSLLTSRNWLRAAVPRPTSPAHMSSDATRGRRATIARVSTRLVLRRLCSYHARAPTLTIGAGELTCGTPRNKRGRTIESTQGEPLAWDSMTHRRGILTEPMAALDYRTAARVAETLGALATPSRLMILAHLRGTPANVSSIVQSIGIERTTVSQQLRVLRAQGLVVAEKQGRHVNYRLFDDHVSRLVDEAVFHSEHLSLRRASDYLTDIETSMHKEPVDEPSGNALAPA